jgi:hypothetical protein
MKPDDLLQCSQDPATFRFLDTVWSIPQSGGLRLQYLS